MRISGTLFTLVNFLCTALICIIMPFAAWRDYEFTRLETDYYKQRYTFYFLYIVLSNIRFGAIDSMQLLICEGILLSQIQSMLMYNELSLSLIIFLMTPFLLIQNAKIAFEVLLF